MNHQTALYRDASQPIEARVSDLLARMTLEEKVGQLNLQTYKGISLDAEFAAGRVGSIICSDNAWAGNTKQERVRHATLDKAQRICVERSRLGIPLLIGRDVIHGYRTICPIPLGQAATWSPELVEQVAAMAAREARAEGIAWTYAPMLDIARDPRWGRIAEGFGEDPWLASRLAEAAVRGFQGPDMAAPDRLAACAKHYVGYGAAEGGRDYDTCEITGNTLRNVYLPPFLAAVRAGVASVMSAFHEIGGVPATANRDLLRGVLKKEWGWDGMVVSDWGSVREIVVHGFAGDDAEAARLALNAGCDLDMCSNAYASHLVAEVQAGRVPVSEVDDAVSRVLRLKIRLGLFERPYADRSGAVTALSPAHRAAARAAARAGVVLLKNDRAALPLLPEARVGVFGQSHLLETCGWLNGTWSLDGDEADGISLRTAFGERMKQPVFAGLADDAVSQARQCDVNVVILGESQGRSGESNNVVSIEPPPGQVELLARVADMGKPVVALVIAGRALALTRVCRYADAVVLAFHPGIEGTRGILDVLLGEAEPVGRLPVSLPRSTGQVPMHYNHKRTGRPRVEDGATYFMGVRWVDELTTPLFPFGYGLGWTTWEFLDVKVDRAAIPVGGTVRVSATVANRGSRRGSTVAQCYVRDVAASRTRPVKELKGFRRIELDAGAEEEVVFTLGPDALGFYGAGDTFRVEPGEFRVGVGSDCRTELTAAFQVVEARDV